MMEKVKKIPQVKCGFCGVKSEKPLMIQDANKKYYHISSCHNEFLADKAFKQKEFQEKLKLSHKIAEIYELESIQLIPHQFYPFLEDVRNDSKLFGRLGKSYKNGIKYSGILYTYEYCKGSIKDARKTKEFKNFLMELRYGLAIVRNNLADAKSHFELLQRTKTSAELGMKKVEKSMLNDNEVIFKSNKSKKDISKFL